MVGAMLLFFGCSSNPIVGSYEPTDAAESCIAEIGPPFTSDGHLYTTLTITELAGFPYERQLAIAYFSQYPDLDLDYEAVPVALKYSLLPHKWKWRNDIMGKLHSLHGGGLSAINERRGLIRKALSKSIVDPAQDWKSGLLIHAFGDAYAHTKNDFNSDDERAYGVLIGHAVPTLLGNSPDRIKSHQNEPKYLVYINELYQSLSMDTSNDDKFMDFLRFVDALECPGNKCPNFHALYHGDVDIGNAQVNKFQTCMNKNMRQLTIAEVQSVMDSIVAD